MDNQIHETQSNAPPPGAPSKLKTVWEALPVLQFVGAGVIGLCAAWTAIQLTQNSQAAEIRETRNKVTTLETYFDKQNAADGRQLDELKKTLVTKDVFDERTNTILKQIELMRQERAADRDYWERVLQNQNR